MSIFATQLLGDKAHAPGQPQVVHASVSLLQAAPASFTDPLFIVFDYDPNTAYKIANWPAVHGGTLPAPGADVLLIIDDNCSMRVAWWDGGYTAESPTGTVGGDLSGTLPDPEVATVLNGKTPLVANNNLSDILSASSARTHLGLGSAAVRAMTCGTSSVTFAASQTSAQKTVAHGLGTTPTSVVCMADGWFGVIVENGSAPPDGTNFYVIGWDLNGSTTNTLPFFWVAVA
jgi:hypothetical protein